MEFMVNINDACDKYKKYSPELNLLPCSVALTCHFTSMSIQTCNVLYVGTDESLAAWWNSDVKFNQLKQWACCGLYCFKSGYCSKEGLNIYTSSTACVNIYHNQLMNSSLMTKHLFWKVFDHQIHSVHWGPVGPNCWEILSKNSWDIERAGQTSGNRDRLITSCSSVSEGLWHSCIKHKSSSSNPLITSSASLCSCVGR